LIQHTLDRCHSRESLEDIYGSTIARISMVEGAAFLAAEITEPLNSPWLPKSPNR
jgi:hypothetical protein